MRLSLLVLAGVLASVAAHPASAEQREFCADRPGLGTPPCTLAPGEAMLEVGLAGIERDAQSDTVTDTLTAADTVLRLGLTARSEVQFGLTGLVHTRQRDRASGAVEHDTGVGDGLIAIRRGLAGPNGPVAVQAFATLPIGHGAASAGDWGAGVLLPLGIAMPSGFAFALTPEVDAAVDGDGDGRHLAYGGVAGLSHDVAGNLSAAFELAAFEDHDPAGHALDARLAGSLAWELAPGWQVDAEADVGLSHAAPDHAFLIGFARRLR